MQADNRSSAMRSTQQHSLVLLATSILVQHSSQHKRVRLLPSFLENEQHLAT